MESQSSYCIFEKRICRFAKKEGNSFECTAKTDEEMPCFWQKAVDGIIKTLSK